MNFSTPPNATLLLYIAINRQGELEYRNSQWKARTGELMVGFPDLPNGGVRCSMSYFTLLPVEEGESVEAGRFYEYNGNFIAPLDSASLSMTVGYGQHVWVDYVHLDMLYNGTPRENECTKDVSVNPGTPCIFPFELLGNIVPFCSKTGYYSEGFGWCANAVNDDGISCLAGCEVQGETWDSCNHCTGTTQDEDVASCEPDRRTTMEGAPCVFPFVYNGKRYTDCTIDPYDTWVDGCFPPTRPWCALDREAFRIGECAPCGDFEVSTSELEGKSNCQSFDTSAINVPFFSCCCFFLYSLIIGTT
jgi:hypothetical protein